MKMQALQMAHMHEEQSIEMRVIADESGFAPMPKRPILIRKGKWF